MRLGMLVEPVGPIMVEAGSEHPIVEIEDQRPWRIAVTGDELEEAPVLVEGPGNLPGIVKAIGSKRPVAERIRPARPQGDNCWLQIGDTGELVGEIGVAVSAAPDAVGATVLP